MSQEKPHSSKKAVITIVSIIILLIILFAPIIPVDVSYQELVPYERKAKYEVIDTSLRQGFDLIRGLYTIMEVTIKNVDKSGGTFTIEHRLYTINGLFGTKTIREYLGPGETKTFRAEFDTKLGQDVRGEYTVQPPTIIDQKL